MRGSKPELNEASGNLQTNAHKMLTEMTLAARLISPVELNRRW